jgi:ABC-type transport system involved in multi-copper enzyme maturation permease subunit
MSAINSAGKPYAGAPAREFAGRVTQLYVLRSEWTKLWSLRSTRWSLLASFVAMAGLGPLAAAVQMGHWSQLSFHDRLTYDSINTAVGGYNLAQLALGVLGVLVISGEYSTGMIRSSLMAVPTRLPVLWAKILVYAVVTFVLMLVASFISFFAVQAIVTQHHVQHAIGDPGALRTVIGAPLYMTALAVLCVGLGALLRNTAGGIATFVGLLFVLPGISEILPASLDHSISKYLPLGAGTTVATHSFENPYHLGVWGGFALFCGYAVIAVAAGAFSLLRRDA